MMILSTNKENLQRLLMSLKTSLKTMEENFKYFIVLKSESFFDYQ